MLSFVLENKPLTKDWGLNERGNSLNYEVIVVGAGHAGCEAALAAAKLGAKTLLLTISPDTIGAMSCNPAIGGPAAKSHLIKELDALGGTMGRVIDQTYLNIRHLNESRGPAVAALRAQADKKKYQTEMTLRVEKEPNIHLKQGLVKEITVSNQRVTGVILQSGRIYSAQVVILATGTFLGGVIVMGTTRYQGGRQGEPAATELSLNLVKLGFKLRRFQTATPPRIHRRSVNFAKLTPQALQETEWGFSWEGLQRKRVQQPCWHTTTTPETINIIRDNLEQSPIQSGSITGNGPHFCPSIDRKVLRFPEKTDHSIFLEPESETTEELYLLGLTTAMPELIQEKIITSIPGLESAEIIRPGYAVEYDCLDSFQFGPSLESKVVENLFSAGQINGTSGYEEAAVQGLIAGINAFRKIKGMAPYIPDRSNSYIGVLIDDLVTKGTEEPYRMMTSLAEFRLFLRLDNAVFRLGRDGCNLGLFNDQQCAKLLDLLKQGESFKALIMETKVKPDFSYWNKITDISPKRGYRISELALRPQITDQILISQFADLQKFPKPVREYVWNELKLAGYLQRQATQRTEHQRLEAIKIPADFNYQNLSGLSETGRQKLEKVRPVSLGQAFRIPRLEPGDQTVLLLYLNPSKGDPLKTDERAI